jgi:hypothetical protein
MVRSFLIAAVFLVVALGALAPVPSNRSQEPAPAHLHPAVPANQALMIDGAEHPELIPDSTAYRLFFNTVAEVPNPKQDCKARQLAYLGSAGLKGDNDLQAAIETLAAFKAQYSDLIARYNQSAEESSAKGQSPDLATFLTQRNALVQTTRNGLETVLSADAMTRLHAHIQREKRKMKISKEELR